MEFLYEIMVLSQRRLITQQKEGVKLNNKTPFHHKLLIVFADNVD